MDIVDQLDAIAHKESNPLLARASDAIVLEREIGDKLFRALQIATDGSQGALGAQMIIDEAVECYQMARGVYFYV